MTTDVLAQHVDEPTGTRHRSVLLDARRLHCHDCRRTLVLPAAAGSTSTSTGPAALHAPDRCELHPGQRAGAACGRCRSDRLERTGETPVPQPTADVPARAAEARAALATRQRARDLAAQTTTAEPQETRS